MALDSSYYLPLPSNYSLSDNAIFLIKPFGSNQYYTANIGQLKKANVLGSGGSNESFIFVQQTGDYTLPDYSIEEKAINGLGKNYLVRGNSTNTISVPTSWTQGNSIPIDNTKDNYFFTQVQFGKVIYNVVTDTSPDTVAPSFVSAVTTNANLITVTFSKALAGTSNFTSSGFTISTQTIVGSSVQIVPISAITQGQSLSITGGNTLTNSTGEASFAGLLNQTVTNNISSFTNTKSVGPFTSSQKLKTQLNPVNLGFGSGGTDNEFSISGYFYNSATTSNSQVIISASDNSSANYFYELSINSSNKLSFLLYNSDASAAIGKVTSATLPTNTWIFYTITYNANKLSSGITITLNGTSVSTTDNPFGSYNGMAAFTSSSVVTLGGFANLTTYTYLGLFDEVAIWDKALSGSEIINIYNNGTVKDLYTSSAVANLKSWWRFENNLIDSGPNGYNLSSSSPVTYSSNKPS